jgi:HlyD family secretion protein
MSRVLTGALVTAAIVATGGAWHHFHAAGDAPQLSLASAVRGDVIKSVACTGTLVAVSTVDVGSQVSGTVSELDVDFNSLVHRGDVLARLDPLLFQTRIAQATSALQMATAGVEAGRVAVSDATLKRDRAHALAARQLIPQSDVDDADVAVREAEAQLHADEGAVLEARGQLDQSKVDLAHTVIVSPIDGIIIDRKIDVGQTVAASFEAPSLFSVAGDLTRLQLEAVVDESDIGQVRTGERTRFTVEAYPDEGFPGAVTQVRLQPQVVQNAVSYTVIVAVDNDQLRLRPGMTATVDIEVARHEAVLRVPTVALRFRPTPAVLRAFGERSLDRASARVPQVFVPGSTAQLWIGRQGRLEPQTVRVGLSDGRFTEVVGLEEGTQVALMAAVAPAAHLAVNSSPLAPPVMRWR